MTTLTLIKMSDIAAFETAMTPAPVAVIYAMHESGDRAVLCAIYPDDLIVQSLPDYRMVATETEVTTAFPSAVKVAGWGISQ